MPLRFSLSILTFLIFLLPPSVRAQQPSCLDCHPDKSENTVVHPAVSMGCESCHSGTHMGEQPAPKLMMEVPGLCFGCHDQSMFQKDVQHAPVAGGMCPSCHTPHAGPNAKLLTAALPDLCFTCHDQSMFQKDVQHAPVAGGMCPSCHTPHAGPNTKLLTAAVPDLCFTCHDQSAFQKTVQHPPAAGGMCLSCHGPHASTNASLMIDTMNGVCTSCHDQQASGKHVMKAFGPQDRHPLQGRPDPLRPGRTLSCVSCHQPHASDRELLFQGSATSQPGICLHCHRKVAVVP